MSFDPMWLFFSMIPSGIGFVLFVYGRKQERLPQLVGGLVLMIYPYFAPTILSMLLIGAAICALTYYAIWAGW